MECRAILVVLGIAGYSVAVVSRVSSIEYVGLTLLVVDVDGPVRAADEEETAMLVSSEMVGMGRYVKSSSGAVLFMLTFLRSGALANGALLGTVWVELERWLGEAVMRGFQKTPL